MFFDDVDLFISPSRFLAGRFRSWGLPDEKLAVLENMPPERDGSPFAEAWTQPNEAPEPLEPGSLSTRSVTAPGATARRAQLRRPREVLRAGGLRTLRFGFFGQMSPLKGITVLMEAARRLNTLGIANAVIEIYGDYSSQPLEFQKVVEEALEEAGENVVFHGAYDNSQVNALMQGIDAMVIPSTWWENSPVVIQEAFHQRQAGDLFQHRRHGREDHPRRQRHAFRGEPSGEPSGSAGRPRDASRQARGAGRRRASAPDRGRGARPAPGALQPSSFLNRQQAYS